MKADMSEQNQESDFLLAQTRFGFHWGAAQVERAASDPKYGVWILVKTPYQELQVWVTPSGRRINTHLRKRPQSERKREQAR